MASLTSTFVARKVVRSMSTRFQPVGAGFETTQIRVSNFTEAMDPFIHIDHFHMALPYFPPHPHAGFCPVTFVFEDSQGSFQNRDTVDPDKIVKIQPGDIFWSTAAAGLVHEELPSESGKDVHGLQIFINLASEHKEAKARHDHLPASKIPIVTKDNGVRVRVVVGEHDGAESPLKPLTTVTMLDVTVPKGQTFQHRVPVGWNAFALSIKGSGKFADSQTGPMAAVAFDSVGDLIEYQADEDSSFVLMSGPPINEPIVSGGGFVGVSREQILKYQSDYATGRMGRLTPSF